MRAIEIPKFKAVSSGLKSFAEIFGENGFDKWMQAHMHLLKDLIYASPDFMWHEGDKSVWIWAIKDDVTEKDTSPYEIIEFEGGMYLVATGDENNKDDLNETVTCMRKWIEDSDTFEYGNFPKSGMCHMPNGGGAIDKALGIAQQEIFLPIKFRQK